MSYSAGQRIAAETLGSAILLATVVGSGIMAESLSSGNLAVALLGNAIATGAMLYVLIGMFGPVSGAHFNPAVTLVFAVRRETPLAEAAAYLLAQGFGTMLGVFLAHAMFAQPLLQTSEHVRTGLGQWLSESVATFALVLTILGTRQARPDAVPAAVALVIVAGYWFTASTSFANPAVTLARGFTNTFSGIAPIDVPAFVVAQIVGAMLALLVGHATFGWKSSAR